MRPACTYYDSLSHSRVYIPPQTSSAQIHRSLRMLVRPPPHAWIRPPAALQLRRVLPTCSPDVYAHVHAPHTRLFDVALLLYPSWTEVQLITSTLPSPPIHQTKYRFHALTSIAKMPHHVQHRPSPLYIILPPPSPLPFHSRRRPRSHVIASSWIFLFPFHSLPFTIVPCSSPSCGPFCMNTNRVGSPCQTAKYIDPE